MNRFEKYKPAVSKHVLILLAGMFWVVAGIVVFLISLKWDLFTFHENFFSFLTFSFIIFLIFYFIIFLKIVRRNIKRIDNMVGKKCVFSFLPWRSYVIIVLMMAMGYFLRHSEIYKYYLKILYSGIGSALFLSGAKYIIHFSRKSKS